MRLRLRVAPRGPFNVESVVPMWFVPWLLNLFGLFDPDQVRDGADHATHRHVIWQRYGDTQLAEAEPLDGPLVLLGAVDAAPDQRHTQRLGHDLLPDLFEALATQARRGVGAAQLLERVDGGVDDVVRVRGPDALGEDVLHPGHLEHRADGPPGDDARSGAGRTEQHGAR